MEIVIVLSRKVGRQSYGGTNDWRKHVQQA